MNRVEPLPEGRCDFIYTVDLGERSVTWLLKMAVDLLSDPKWVCLVRPAGGHISGGCSFIHLFVHVFFFPTPSLGPGFQTLC